MLHGFPSTSKAVILTAAIVLVFLTARKLFFYPQFPEWQAPAPKPPVAPQNPHVPDHPDVPEHHSDGPETPNLQEPPRIPEEHEEPLPCQKLPGAEDVVVIMRTGATEIQDKLPIHFNTTFRCYQDLLVFSDYEEVFQGHQVHDVLANVDQNLKETNRDFEIYLRLQDHGREALHEDELSGKASFEGSKSGKNDNAGWRLDKWKFLPMMRETLYLRPHKKWYVFLETDSYVVWSSLLQWLETQDPSKPFYVGSEVQIGDDIFAHGGSVFVMSRSAIEKGADIYSSKVREWHAWTAGHWAGDCVLGKALLEAGVPLAWAWPMFQGGQPEKMDFTETKGDRKLWCAPALSYHHFSPIEMRRMWQFEQNWILAKQDDGPADPKRWSYWAAEHGEVLHHRDVFKAYVWPNITTERSEWNNMSPDPVRNTEYSTFEDCEDLCDKNGDCLQFSLGREGCSMSTKEVMLGGAWGDMRSGWRIDRIEKWMERLDHCRGSDGWVI